jgi:hypothetical protein
MFPDYHLMKVLVADHRSVLEDDAKRRRFLRAGRRTEAAATPIRPDRATAAVEALPSAARHAVSLGRTPSENDRAA